MLRYAHRKRNRNTGDGKETHQHDRNSLWYDDVHDGHGDDDHAQAFVRLREKPLLCVTVMLFRRAESGDAFRPLYFQQQRKKDIMIKLEHISKTF